MRCYQSKNTRELQVQLPVVLAVAVSFDNLLEHLPPLKG
ncbi:hypothetical protein THOE12_10400 [Vibrio rotiferianus]|nr:hypothetical protein THOE12_10400 [Vibrio rotiferianus]